MWPKPKIRPHEMKNIHAHGFKQIVTIFNKHREGLISLDEFLDDLENIVKYNNIQTDKNGHIIK